MYGVAAAAIPAAAGTIIMPIDTEFSGAASPAGNGENPKGWFFNLNPLMDPADLTFTHTGGTNASGIHREANQDYAGPDRVYDFVMQSATAWSAAMLPSLTSRSLAAGCWPRRSITSRVGAPRARPGSTPRSTCRASKIRRAARARPAGWQVG